MLTGTVELQSSVGLDSSVGEVTSCGNQFHSQTLGTRLLHGALFVRIKQTIPLHPALGIIIGDSLPPNPIRFLGTAGAAVPSRPAVPCECNKAQNKAGLHPGSSP